MSISPNLKLIGTCPPFHPGFTLAQYKEAVRLEASRAERCGLSALLIYSDHSQVDPWLAANILLGESQSISPLVAVQPMYMHPFSVAKMVCSLSTMYRRPVHLNFISGGFPRDLETFCDEASHDQRYARVVEYGEIIRRLITERRPCTFDGQYYRVSGLQLRAGPLAGDCIPMFTISGSSPAGEAAARQLGARAIQYLRPSKEYRAGNLSIGLRHGTRLGLIVRDTAAEAWAVAHGRYPDNPNGEEMRDYFMKVSDSVWVKELGRAVDIPVGHPYWLGPYRQFYAGCPFLVGSVEDVASELACYIDLGLRTFLLELLLSDEDGEYISAAFRRAADILKDKHPAKALQHFRGS